MTVTRILMLGNLLEAWEIILILAIILVLHGSKNLPDNTRRNLADPTKPSPMEEFILWIAQGFDVGRISIAPGTFGSLLGLLWFATLLVPGSLTFYLVATFVGLVVSVWVCGEAERILQQTDPGSVVFDEIAAVPVCFLPWVLSACSHLKEMPPVETFFTGRGLFMTAVIFILFRIFDVAKPWPVRQSQELPAGLGVTMDDFLAAGYVALITLFFAI
jgi:phosphatidylglycerophosphatase A